MLSNLELSTLAKTLLQGTVQEGRAKVNELERQVAAVVALQNMRENASLIKMLYDEYPDLDAATFGFYYCGPAEMDFIVRDVVVSGEDDADLEELLVDTLSNYPGKSPLSGTLNSDGDMLKFYEVLTAYDRQLQARLLETTRDRVQKGLQGGDLSTLAAELFPAAWAEHAQTVGLQREGERRPRLTIFASTGNLSLAMMEIGYPWLEKAEAMAKLSCENKVNITIPTYFWLQGDDSYESSAHEAVIIPGPQWNPATATIQFSAYENDDVNERITTVEIGLTELRQAFESGMRELCVDFGSETLTVEEGMEAFNLVRADDGSLIEAPQTAPGSRPSAG